MFPTVDFAHLTPDDRAKLAHETTLAHEPSKRAIRDQIKAARICEQWGLLYDSTGKTIAPSFRDPS